MAEGNKRGLEQENIWLISEMFIEEVSEQGVGECN